MKLGEKIALAAIILAVIFAIGWSEGRRSVENDIVTDTVVVHHTDTVRLTDVVHDTVTMTYTKTVHVPLVSVSHDTIVDSVWVSLPYEQHFVQLDSVADVWYSGFDAKIDSAVVYKYMTTQIITQLVTDSRPNMIGASASIGDAALFYARRIGPVWLGASAGMTFDRQPTIRAGIGYTF